MRHMHPEKKFAAARARERMCPPSTSLGTPTHTWKQVPLDFARDTTSWSDKQVPLDFARDTTSWSDVVGFMPVPSGVDESPRSALLYSRDSSASVGSPVSERRPAWGAPRSRLVSVGGVLPSNSSPCLGCAPPRGAADRRSLRRSRNRRRIRGCNRKTLATARRGAPRLRSGHHILVG